MQSNWNLEMSIFEERGKPKNPEKNLSEQSKETTDNLTYSWPRVLNRTRAKLVGGKCNHHCAIPALKNHDYHFAKSILCNALTIHGGWEGSPPPLLALPPAASHHERLNGSLSHLLIQNEN